MECVLNNPKVLLFENNISNAQDLANFLNKYIKQHPEDPLLIIADSIDGDALYTLVKNRLEKGRMWVAVKTPGFQSNATAWMQDLSFVTGAKFITKESGTKLENVNLSDLGNIGRAVITSDTTTLIGSKVTREMIDEYIAKLKEQLTLAEKNSAKEFIKLRIAKLDGGVGLIKVGGATEGETVEKLYRYEDSIAATKAAIKDGVLPGGGIALLKVKEELEYNLGSMKRSRAYSNSFLSGYRFVVENLDVPFKAIIKNAGFNVNQVYKKVKRTNDVDNFGFNAKTGQFVSMFNDGIVDAAAVTKAAIKNAVSVAGTILTTEVVVNKEAEKQSFEG
jgi:chaperonin GroEL